MLDLVACGTACLLLDQWSKRAAIARVNGPRGWATSILRPVLNSNGLGNRAFHGAALVAFWCAALAAAVVLIRSGVWFRSSAARFGVAAALGGAAGNLLDMLRRRSVVDFIDVGWWPCFNLADVAIVCGLALAFGS